MAWAVTDGHARFAKGALVEIGDLLRRAASQFGDAPAVTCGDRTLSFREFDSATDRLGNALLRCGLVPGDRVAVLLPNGIDGLLAYYALAKSGLVRVSLNVRDTPEDHEFRLRDSGSRALISDWSGSASVEMHFGPDELARLTSDGPAGRCDVPRDAEAPYRLGYTGGTTGPPKAVTLSLRSEHAEITNYLLDLIPGIGPGDVMVHAAPVTHASGSFFLPHLVRGAHNVMLPSFDPAALLEELQRRNATATFLVPTMLAMVLEEPGVEDVKTPALRRLCYGASPIAPSVATRAEEVFGQVLAQTYGQAEAPMTITLLRPEEHDRVGSAGRPYAMVEVRIVDKDDREVPPGETGEVVVRGQIVMSGYWNRPEETARTLRGGWLHTGDVGRFDDGFLYLLDRRNDVIISGGFNVYPREVEDVLIEHPQVREAAVIGMPDERWGEVVHAVVSTRGPVDPAEVLDWSRSRLAGYKRPRAVHIRDDLPKSSAGKILRRAVRDELRAGQADNHTAGPRQRETMEMELRLLVLHGLAVRKSGAADQIATILGRDTPEVQAELDRGVAAGDVLSAKGMFMPTPAGLSRINAAYGLAYAAVRSPGGFTAAADRFEVLNKRLLAVLTRWQTISRAGASVPNDHSDPAYDAKIIDELGDLHEHTEPVLGTFIAHLPRYSAYNDRLVSAYEQRPRWPDQLRQWCPRGQLPRRLA